MTLVLPMAGNKSLKQANKLQRKKKDLMKINKNNINTFHFNAAVAECSVAVAACSKRKAAACWAAAL